MRVFSRHKEPKGAFQACKDSHDQDIIDSGKEFIFEQTLITAPLSPHTQTHTMCMCVHMCASVSTLAARAG